jgi:hypothetical protein
MDSSYGAPVKAPEKADGEKPSIDQENEDSGESTALISNKILSPEGEPIKPGDEIVLQVVKNYGDESEVKYAPHKGGEDKETTETTTTPEEDFAAMDTEKA